MQSTNLIDNKLLGIIPHLILLAAHDRVGFGGASCGAALFCCVWCEAPSPSLWQVLALAGGGGFATAIGGHLLLGYPDFSHLAPASVGLGLFVAGRWLRHYPERTGSAQRSDKVLPSILA